MNLITKKLLFIIAATLLYSAQARPTDDDFTIDMYQGGNHLRYERSAEASSSGTVVTVEAGKEAQAATAQVEKVESEPVKLEDALTLVRNTMEKVEAENSAQESMWLSPALAKTEATEAAKPTATDTAKSTVTETAKSTAAKAAPATATVSDAVKSPAAVPTAAAEHVKEVVHIADHKPVTITSSTSLISTPRQTKLNHDEAGEDASALDQWSQRYVNPYGNVLNRINMGMSQPLASSRYKSFTPNVLTSKAYQQVAPDFNRPLARTLSAPVLIQQNAPTGSDSSRSFSRISIGGVDVDPSEFSSPKIKSIQPAFSPKGSLTAGFGEFPAMLTNQQWNPYSKAKLLSSPHKKHKKHRFQF